MEEREGRAERVLVQGLDPERIKKARRKIEEHIRQNPEAVVLVARAFGIKI